MIEEASPQLNHVAHFVVTRFGLSPKDETNFCKPYPVYIWMEIECAAHVL